VSRTARSDGRLDNGIALVCVVLSLFGLIMPRSSRDRVAASLRTTVFAPVAALQSRAAAVRAAVDTRPETLRASGQVAARLLVVQGVADENATLRQLLGLSARLESGFVPADVVPSGAFDENFTLTLNAGSRSGVQRFFPVVTGAGLVGMIEQVDVARSHAITWAHPDFRVSAMSEDGTAFGIVQPHLGRGAERWLLELRGVRFRAKLDTGAVIVSSGLGATYPRGIVIGTVMAELSTPEKWARTYLVKPSVLPSAIGPVLVLLLPGTPRDLNGVWTTIASTDSAARAVAASGDSIARAAAFDELAARRAALDSVGIDSLRLDSLLRLMPGFPRRDSMPRDTVRRDTVRRDSVLRTSRVPGDER